MAKHRSKETAETKLGNAHPQHAKKEDETKEIVPPITKMDLPPRGRGITVENW